MYDETKPEKERNDEDVQQDSQGTDPYGYCEAMKDAPTFEEQQKLREQEQEEDQEQEM